MIRVKMTPSIRKYLLSASASLFLLAFGYATGTVILTWAGPLAVALLLLEERLGKKERGEVNVQKHTG